ncbi:hypothetical protein HMPREF1032_02630 [Subdoligranulum sp. 4_3_54A2FAA]|nr:hypothetical protein HMPREF1032_02630 [Subdoligranulum sp. 4_3_54A2FAA]
MYIIKIADSLDDFLKNLAQYPEGRVACEPWGVQFPCVEKPDTRFRLAHSDDAIFVHMRCTNDDVRSTVREHYGPVNSDSCMEFYFAPGGDRSQYFNMEANPAGFLRLKFGGTDRAGRVIPSFRFEELDLRMKADPAEGTWTLAYTLPYSLIRDMEPDFSGAEGTKIYGMFCKCGDLCREPHFFTSAPVDTAARSEPDFHAPEAFEEYLFE